MTRFAKPMRPVNLKKTQENIKRLSELLDDTDVTTRYASDNLIEAMAEITTHWRQILSNWTEEMPNE